MNESLSAQLRPLQRYCDHVLLQSPRRFVAFGNAQYDDMLVTGSLTSSVKSSAMYLGDVLVDDDPTRTSSLYEDVLDLMDAGTLGRFTMRVRLHEQYIQCIRDFDATHIRFHSAGQGVHCNIFDVRRYVYGARMHRDKEVWMLKDQISKDACKPFSVTVLARSFMTMPRDDYQVRIGRNGTAVFSSSSTDVEYVFRDQQIREPLVNIVTEQSDSGISLWLHRS